MDVPDDLQYSTDHEWLRNDEGRLRIGITDYARDALGDIVFLSLPEVGVVLEAGSVAGEVESTKAVSEIYVPVTGTVIEINTALVETPEVLNDDPYGAGWLFVIEPSDPSSAANLLDAAAYRALTQE